MANRRHDWIQTRAGKHERTRWRCSRCGMLQTFFAGPRGGLFVTYKRAMQAHPVAAGSAGTFRQPACVTQEVDQ